VGVTGTITLICPVTTAPLLTVSPTVLEILYYDSNGATSQQTFASYIKQNKSTGATSVVATISSNTCPGGLYCSVAFSDSFAPGSYRYYVLVQIIRTSTSVDERSYAVGIY